MPKPSEFIDNILKSFKDSSSTYDACVSREYNKLTKEQRKELEDSWENHLGSSLNEFVPESSSGNFNHSDYDNYPDYEG